MKKDVDLLFISKKFLDKDSTKKIKSIRDKQEKINLIKYLIISKMKLMHLELELLLKNSKEIEDFEVLLLKTSNINHKIRLLEHNLNQKDFKKILLLINNIKSRLTNV